MFVPLLEMMTSADFEDKEDKKKEKERDLKKTRVREQEREAYNLFPD
jgi:hypothetical protein